MVKSKKFCNKKNSSQKCSKSVVGGKLKTPTLNESTGDTLEYDVVDNDSMIENGSSEESESENEEQIEGSSVNNESGSDDGFSDREEELQHFKSNLIKNENINKRKHETSTKEIIQNKKYKVNTSAPEKTKAPTLEEINEMKETRNLFHSNIFRLQVKEMLQEVKIKDKYNNYINKFLEQFKNFIDSLENMPEKEDMDKLVWLKKSKITPPLNLQLLNVARQKVFQFQFIKPSIEPFLLGGCNTQTLLGPKLQVDIGVIMPGECWQKENYLNLQYDQKRAIYLAYLTAKLLETQTIPNLTINHLKFNYYNNNPLKPILEITPPAEAGKHLAQKLSIRIFIASEPQPFKLNRFVPWNNNLRSTLFENNADDDTVALATPSYNANILFDLTMHANQKLLHELFHKHKHFQDGLVLIKVWLRQRQLDVGYSGFNAHIMAMFIVYLFKQHKLHSNMSSYQVARNIWNHLAFSSWNENNNGISLCSGDNTTSNQPSLEQFHSYYPVVFIDVTGFHNICSNISVDVYKRVCLEAKLAVDMLNDMKLNSFQYLFLTKLPLYTQVDQILKINKPDAVEQIMEMHVSPADKLNNAGFVYPLLLKLVTSLLQKGLGKRIDFMIPLEQLTLAWCVNESAVAPPQYLHLGLILNPEHAYEILDKGPESIDNEAEKFRAFWGEKAQLRRFQDGTITESVVWAAHNDDLSKKRRIVRSIVLHLLQYHFQLEEKDLEYIAGEFDTVFELTKGFKVANLNFPKTKIAQDTNAEAMTLHVIRVFDDLARKLSDLKELPLEIVSIAGISPVFRYCEPQPILPRARCIKEQIYADHIQYGVIQLGESGKWPSEIGATRALKTAFYIKIAELLQEKHKLLCKVSYDGVLVLKDGFCFVLEIAHPKEVGLLKRAKTDKGLTTHIDCPESMALEKRHYILPKVTGALKALYQNYSSFGPAVMIAKRWLYCQLFDDGLWPQECTELLIASQYLKTPAKCVTNSPQIGFIRFLQLLAHTDWKSELFLLNFNTAMEESEISDLEHCFSNERNTFPPLCIATSYDQKHFGKIWSSEQQPNAHVLARVTLLARQSLEIIETTLLSTSLTMIKPAKIFKAPTDGYDLLIQLNAENVPNTLAFEFGSSFVAFAKPNWHMPLAGSNFLQNSVLKLREAYSDFAAFFYNPCGGKEIAVIWKPAAFNLKPFKVSDVNGCSLTADHKNIQAKKEILIEDFKFILKDFYLHIGSLEFVREANKSKVNKLQQKTSSLTKSRYFVATSAAKESKKSTLKNKYAVIVKRKENWTAMVPNSFKAKSKIK